MSVGAKAAAVRLSSRRDLRRHHLGRALRIGLLASMPLVFTVLTVAQYTGLYDAFDLIKASEPYQLLALAVGVLMLAAAIMMSNLRGGR